jgi:hypothetical protein
VWCSIVDSSESRSEIPVTFFCDVGEGWSKIGHTDRVKNDGVLQRIKEEGNILTQYKA